jgi:hypothetical protein
VGGVDGERHARGTPDELGAPSDRLCSLADWRLISLLIRTPVRLEWDHEPGSQHQPRHRSGRRCRGAGVRPGPPCRRRCRGGRPASCRLFVGGPASGGVDRGRGPVRRHPGPGRRTGCAAGRGVLCGEFAAAVGLPTETGKAYLGEALELRHRLPRTWARVRAGELPAWRARRIARATIALSRRRRGSWTTRSPGSRTGSAQRGGPAGRGGDRPVHARGGPPPREAAATAGTSTCTPVRCPSRAPCGWRPRSTWPTPWTWTPPSRQVPPGSPTSARPRRWTCAAPKPSGQMARHQLLAGPRHLPTPGTDASSTPVRTPGRQVVMHVHLCRAAPHRPRHPPRKLHLARVANTRCFVDADQVRTWCVSPAPR